jgi:hypothetical protein
MVCGWRTGDFHLKSNDKMRSKVSTKIPSFIPHTKPTPPDGKLNVTRTNPTPLDQSDRLLPPHNPSVVGSIPTGPTRRNTKS